MRLLHRLTPALLTAAFFAPPASAAYRVTLAPAAGERAGQIIEFKLPPEAGRVSAVRDSAGRAWPVQVDTDGTARFVVARQPAGETLVFTLGEGVPTAGGGVAVAPEAGDLQIRVGGRLALVYRLDREKLPRPDIRPEFKRAGYLHPVFSPAGRVVTDDYPSNHVHHHGIWTAWTKTRFQGRTPDFWNMATKTGAEDLVALERTWSGAVHGGFSARLQMIDLSAAQPVVVLHETWAVVAYAVMGAATPVRMFDLRVTQTCATRDPLVLPEYHYGGFGFRGAGGWNGPGDAARFLTSEGVTDRVKGNATRGRWCYLGGPVDGGSAGTAILGHPDNFRAPQPMRLHPDMPYLSFAPQQLGEFSLQPGTPYVARFRFVVTDGPPDRALLDAYWRGYAEPAAVRIDKS